MSLNKQIKLKHKSLDESVYNKKTKIKDVSIGILAGITLTLSGINMLNSLNTINSNNKIEEVRKDIQNKYIKALISIESLTDTYYNRAKKLGFLDTKKDQFYVITTRILIDLFAKYEYSLEHRNLDEKSLGLQKELSHKLFDKIMLLSKIGDADIKQIIDIINFMSKNGISLRGQTCFIGNDFTPELNKKYGKCIDKFNIDDYILILSRLDKNIYNI